MRQIVFDTETTGINPFDGHRIVEIGALEVMNYVPTGRTYHQYINPERDIPEEVVQVHGIDNERVKDEPTFTQIVGEFLEFIGDAELVAHNAEFDMRFINHELRLAGFQHISVDRVIDTLKIARKKFPGSPASLDALCRRFDIDNSSRTYHGALLDSELLAEVYLELMGGRQQGLMLSRDQRHSQEEKNSVTENVTNRSKIWPIRAHQATEDELKAHQDFVDSIEEPIWQKIGS